MTAGDISTEIEEERPIQPLDHSTIFTQSKACNNRVRGLPEQVAGWGVSLFLVDLDNYKLWGVHPNEKIASLVFDVSFGSIKSP